MKTKHSIGRNIVSTLAKRVSFENYSSVFIVTDSNVAKKHLAPLSRVIPLRKNHLILPAGEKSKNIRSAQMIWNALSAAGSDRKTLLIALGGGMITDIAGFAAATYMRGIDCIAVPTSLLAQVDASIGGKTGIDHCGIKNLIGTFTAPKMVIIDIDTLETLPEREFVSGFGEIIKHGLITDKNYFKKATSKLPQEFDSKEIESIVRTSVRIKTAIVEGDPKEGGERQKLNFGHTVGHAIEACALETKKPVLHGEAVSIGMVAEAKISELKGMISKKEMKQIESIIVKAGLPVKTDIPIEKILRKMKLDKKNEDGNIRFVLLKAIGESVCNQTVSRETILKAIGYIQEK